MCTEQIQLLPANSQKRWGTKVKREKGKEKRNKGFWGIRRENTEKKKRRIGCSQDCPGKLAEKQPGMHFFSSLLRLVSVSTWSQISCCCNCHSLSAIFDPAWWSRKHVGFLLQCSSRHFTVLLSHGLSIYLEELIRSCMKWRERMSSMIIFSSPSDSVYAQLSPQADGSLDGYSNDTFPPISSFLLAGPSWHLFLVGSSSSLLPRIWHTSWESTFTKAIFGKFATSAATYLDSRCRNVLNPSTSSIVFSTIHS